MENDIILDRENNIELDRDSYYDKWIKILNEQKAIESKDYLNSIGFRFEELISKGRAISELKLISSRKVIENSDLGNSHGRKYELLLKSEKPEYLESSSIGEGVKVYIYFNRNTLEAFNPKTNDDVGVVTSISNNTITVETILEKNFRDMDYLSMNVLLVHYSESSYVAEINNLKRVFKEEFHGDQKIIDMIVTADKHFNSDAKESISDQDNNYENKEQIIKQAISAQDFFLIHGPPGTGKTQACAEIICETISQNINSRILVCCHSNKAVDNLLTKVGFMLGSFGEEIILRMGRVFKVLPSLNKYTLYEKIMNHPRYKKILEENSNNTLGMIDYYESANQYSRIEKIKSEIADDIRIIFCTTTYAEKMLLGAKIFDLVLIDEASTASEPACLIPISRAKKFILAGDHKQLPPTIKYSKDESDPRNDDLKKIEYTLFQKLIQRYPEKYGELRTQYRMNDDLLWFPNTQFYHSSLASHISIKYSKFNVYFDKSIVFINNKSEEDAHSRYISNINENESEIIKEIVESFVKIGVGPELIGVITFYKSQMKVINAKIAHLGITCKTVDSFQGQEKEIIILSTVRSNTIQNLKGCLGFIHDLRRLNVALTRAKTQLIIIGNSETLTRPAQWERENHFDKFQILIEHIKKEGVYLEEDELADYLKQPSNLDYAQEIEKKNLLLKKSMDMINKLLYEERIKKDDYETNDIKELLLKDEILNNI